MKTKRGWEKKEKKKEEKKKKGRKKEDFDLILYLSFL